MSLSDRPPSRTFLAADTRAVTGLSHFCDGARHRTWPERPRQNGTVVRAVTSVLAGFAILATTALASEAAPPIQALSPAVKAQLIHAKVWKPNCPVPLSKLRLLTVPYWGFDGEEHTGQLVVHEDAAAKLRRVLLKLYAMRFPIRHMQLDDMYGRAASRRRRRHRVVRVPPGRAVAVQRRQRDGHLVEARLRPRARHQPGREPVRRLRHDARQEGALVPRPLARPARHGHAGRDRRVRLGRLGLGRLVDRLDQGLHALLRTTGTEGSRRSRLAAWSHWR